MRPDQARLRWANRLRIVMVPVAANRSLAGVVIVRLGAAELLNGIAHGACGGPIQKLPRNKTRMNTMRPQRQLFSSPGEPPHAAMADRTNEGW